MPGTCPIRRRPGRRRQCQASAPTADFGRCRHHGPGRGRLAPIRDTELRLMAPFHVKAGLRWRSVGAVALVAAGPGSDDPAGGVVTELVNADDPVESPVGEAELESRTRCLRSWRDGAFIRSLGRWRGSVPVGWRRAVGGGRTRTGQALDLMPLPVGLPRRAPGRIRTAILSTLSRAPLPVGLQGLRGTGENRTLMPKQRGYGPRGTPPAQPSREGHSTGTAARKSDARRSRVPGKGQSAIAARGHGEKIEAPAVEHNVISCRPRELLDRHPSTTAHAADGGHAETHGGGLDEGRCCARLRTACRAAR
jgi:hypothetical protein